jgi:cell division protease FtsH
MVKKSKAMNLAVFIAVIVALTFIINSAFNYFSDKPEPLVQYQEVTNVTLLKDIEEGKVDHVYVDKNQSAYYKTENGNFKVPHLNDEVLPILEVNQLVSSSPVAVEESGISPIVYIVLAIAVIAIVLRIILGAIGKTTASLMQNAQAMREGNSKSGTIVQERPNVTFADVAGCDELKESVQNDIECLKNPKMLEEIGARMPKGIVLYGPPGTGKTLIAKAIAGTAGVPFISASGSDFIEMYVGVGAKRIRALYEQAKKCAPCIVFIDEIDAIGGKRGISQNSERDQTINALLTELDGFGGKEGILTICATNRLDMLDSALIRPGRFDKQLAVPLPDKQGRYDILMRHAKGKKLDETVDIKNISEKTTGFSGAELEALLNEAALIAIRRKKRWISAEEVEDAFFQVVMRGNKKRGDREAEENKLIAYHEAGHALVTKLLTDDEVPSVTIVGSTSGAGGVTFRSPKETTVRSKKYLRHLIQVMYGGRAAEYVLLGDEDDITTGASADIKQATELIKQYIGTYGMGKHGMLDIDQFEGSDKALLDEASEMAKNLYDETIALLDANRGTLDRIAGKLIEKETINGDELDELMGLKVISMDNSDSNIDAEIEGVD